MTTSTPIAPPESPPADIGAQAQRGPGGPAPDAVVVGVDGTERGLGAVRWAAHEAARRNAPLRIVHAVPAPRRRTGSDPAPPGSLARRVTARAYTVARHTEADVRTGTEVIPGDPATVLLTAAGQGQLVVLGTSTTGAVDEWVPARVAVRVAGRSPRPVVLVPRRPGAASADLPVTAVLGVGDPEDDDRVAAFAAESAQRAGSALTVLQTRKSRGQTADRWTEHGSEWAARFPGLEVHRRDLPGATPAQVLATTCPAPLVVLSAGHGTLLHRDLDGPHLWLLRHCTSPMALVPPAHRPELDPCEEIIALG